jgi:phage antirepressor YoqD-like protein
MTDVRAVALAAPQVAGQPATMSSLEIAELTGKRHPDVLRDIRNMLEPLGHAYEQYCSKAPSRGGRPITVANLPRRECLILVSGYSVELRARIIDRLEEMDRQEPSVQLPDLANPKVLLAILADYAQDKVHLQDRLNDLTPKAVALERIAEADGTMCVTDAAKVLQVPPKQLFAFLRRHDWIYRRAGGANDVAYQSRIRAGLLTVKVTRLERDDGPDRIAEQVRVTPKGLVRLGELMAAQPSRVDDNTPANNGAPRC